MLVVSVLIAATLCAGAEAATAPVPPVTAATAANGSQPPAGATTTTAATKSAQPEGPRRILVRYLKSGDLGEGPRDTITALITDRVEHRTDLKVLSATDLRSMGDILSDRNDSGCENLDTCALEIGAAVGAGLVLSPSLSKLGSNYFTLLTLADVTKTDPLARVSMQASSLDDVVNKLGASVDELLLRGLGPDLGPAGRTAQQPVAALGGAAPSPGQTSALPTAAAAQRAANATKGGSAAPMIVLVSGAVVGLAGGAVGAIAGLGLLEGSTTLSTRTTTSAQKVAALDAWPLQNTAAWIGGGALVVGVGLAATSFLLE